MPHRDASGTKSSCKKDHFGGEPISVPAGHGDELDIVASESIHNRGAEVHDSGIVHGYTVSGADDTHKIRD